MTCTPVAPHPTHSLSDSLVGLGVLMLDLEAPSAAVDAIADLPESAIQMETDNSENICLTLWAPPRLVPVIDTVSGEMARHINEYLSTVGPGRLTEFRVLPERPAAGWREVRKAARHAAGSTA